MTGFEIGPMRMLRLFAGRHDCQAAKANLVKISRVFDGIAAFAYLSLKVLLRRAASIERELLPLLFAGMVNNYGQIGHAAMEAKLQFS
jgi:hypothetical protein